MVRYNCLRMKTQIITLESHDDLISVRDRLSWAKTPRILLVWPKYEKVTLRQVDLKVLQRHASSLGAQLGLVTRARRDRRAFATLYDRYLDAIYRYCYVRLGNREAADYLAARFREMGLAPLASLNGYRQQISPAVGDNVLALKPAASVVQLMEGPIAHAAEVYWGSVSTIVDKDGIHENFPQNDEEWEAVELAALALVESGNLLMMSPRARDEDGWLQQVNALIAAGHRVEPRWISDEELDARPELVRTMSVKPPMGTGRVRLLEIPGVDLQSCGGTHVRNTSEIGRLGVARIRSEGKRNKRGTLILADHGARA